MSDDDISPLIEAKSDQLNAEDLLGGPRTIRVREVRLLGKREQQPCAIYYDGDDGKPFKPCLTMRRLLAKVWGPRTSQWVGRSMTLWNDPEVKWAGQEVGGVRISHVSHIEQPIKLALAESKGKRRPTTVRPLVGQQVDRAEEGAKAPIARIEQADDPRAISAEDKVIEQRAWLEQNRPELARRVTEAFAKRGRAERREEPDHQQERDGTPFDDTMTIDYLEGETAKVVNDDGGYDGV